VTRRLEIEGRTYELRPWTPADGEPMSFRLLKIAVGVGGAEDDVNSVLARVTEKDFADLRDLVVRYTDIVTRDPSTGEELVRPLARHREELAGRYQDLLALVVAHLQHEFGPFFSSLPTVLGSVFGKTKRATAAGS
jgi:hypothetical protein